MADLSDKGAAWLDARADEQVAIDKATADAVVKAQAVAVALAAVTAKQEQMRADVAKLDPKSKEYADAIRDGDAEVAALVDAVKEAASVSVSTAATSAEAIR